VAVTWSEIEDVFESLAATPPRIAAVTEGLADARLHTKPDEKSWSANDILAHLRACADVWGESIEKMLAQDHPTLKHVSPRTYMRKTDYSQRTFHESFRAFADQRAGLLHQLKQLGVEEWSRGAVIKDREHTIFSQSRRIAQHEGVHCDQIEAVLNTA